PPTSSPITSTSRRWGWASASDRDSSAETASCNPMTASGSLFERSLDVEAGAGRREVRGARGHERESGRRDRTGVVTTPREPLLCIDGPRPAKN
ncbi:hypothetical protein DJ73_11700, partial [Halorubrum sp. Ea1]